MTIPAGFSSYIMGVALAEQINKNSTWLKATAMEGRGAVVNLRTLVAKPEKRNNYLIFSSTGEIWQARNRKGQYGKIDFNFEDVRFVCLLGIAMNGINTLNPDIKTLKDLEGKKVILDDNKNGDRQVTNIGIMKEAGVDVGKINFQYAPPKPATDALRDGLVDVAFNGAALKGLPHSYATSPFTRELLATKSVHFISFPKDAVMAYKKKSGHPLGYRKLPPGSYGPKQTEPVEVLVKPLGFCAHISVPDRVITEALRCAYENAHKFKEYTGMGAVFTKDTMASLGIPEAWYHPAALKFYKEKGVPLVSFGD
jgi:TRAP transporter TAXI family solute receptor